VHWVTTWAAAQQRCEPADLPPAPFTRGTRALADSTLRQTLHVTLGGRRIRLRLCNRFGDTALPVTAGSVALPVAGRAGVSAIRAGTCRRVTFADRNGVVIPAGAQIVSDPLDFDVTAAANVTVSIHLAAGQHPGCITTHPGSRTTSYLATGNHTDDLDLPGAAATDHWYLLSGVMLGDSLTGSNDNDEPQRPLADLLFRRPGRGGRRTSPS
jgi:hypothetical protein